MGDCPRQSRTLITITLDITGKRTTRRDNGKEEGDNRKCMRIPDAGYTRVADNDLRNCNQVRALADELTLVIIKLLLAPPSAAAAPPNERHLSPSDVIIEC